MIFTPGHTDCSSGDLGHASAPRTVSVTVYANSDNGHTMVPGNILLKLNAKSDSGHINSTMLIDLSDRS